MRRLMEKFLVPVVNRKILWLVLGENSLENMNQCFPLPCFTERNAKCMFYPPALSPYARGLKCTRM